MRVVVVNQRLAKRTGTELATWEVGRALARRGHSVTVMAPILGPLAEEIAEEGMVSVSPLNSIRDRPDVIHLNHLTPIADVTAKFPGVPILLQWHTFVPVNLRIPHADISVVCGVTPTINNEIALSTGRMPDAVLGNYVDLSQFTPRTTRLPDAPKKWLLVGQQRGSRRYVWNVLRAAMARQARLSFVGPRFFKRIANLPAYAAEFDLVIASGRCALESLAAGASVIVGDTKGLGDIVTMENVEMYRIGNFSCGTFGGPMSYRGLLTAVDRYDPEVASMAAKWIRDQAAIKHGAARFEQLYQLAIDRAKQRRPCVVASPVIDLSISD